MNKIKDLATKTGATLSVAAFSVLAFLNGSTFASSAASKALDGVKSVNDDGSGNNLAEDDLNGMIRLIITAVIGVIGIVAVIMIILGGVSYTTSQGDPQRTKKAKDTILYGVIGVVVALLAFAIVTFVLTAMGAQ